MGLIAPCYPALLAVAFGQNLKIQTACERAENFLQIGQDIMQLFHVLEAHVLRQARGSRLAFHELAGGLGSLTRRQLRVHEKVGCIPHHCNQISARDVTQNSTGSLRLSHVTLDKARIGLTHFGHRLTGGKVNHSIDIQRRIWLTPTKDWKMNHALTP